MLDLAWGYTMYIVQFTYTLYVSEQWESREGQCTMYNVLETQLSENISGKHTLKIDHRGRRAKYYNRRRKNLELAKYKQPGWLFNRHQMLDQSM